MTENLLFQLSEELEYSTNGQREKTATIEIKPPSYYCLKQAAKLSQLVSRATLDSARFRDMAKNVSPVEENDIDSADLDGDAIRMLLFSSSVDMAEIIDSFSELIIKVGKLSEKERIKETHFKKISYDDLIRMICEYIAHFTFPSLFSVGEKNSK